MLSRRICHDACWNAVEELHFMIAKVLPPENVPEWRADAYEVVWDAIREYGEAVDRERKRLRPVD